MSVCETIESSLNTVLEPSHLEVLNESFMHNTEPGAESHIRIIAVSIKFNELSLVKRHQLIYEEVNEHLEGPVHAITLHTFTPSEWEEKNREANPSPDCLGGGSEVSK